MKINHPFLLALTALLGLFSLDAALASIPAHQTATVNSTIVMDASGNLSSSLTCTMIYRTQNNLGTTNLLGRGPDNSFILTVPAHITSIPTGTNAVSTTTQKYTNLLSNFYKGVQAGPYYLKLSKFDAAREKIVLSGKSIPFAIAGGPSFLSLRPGYNGPIFPTGKGASYGNLGTIQVYKSASNHAYSNILCTLYFYSAGKGKFTPLPSGKAKLKHSAYTTPF